MLQRRNKWSNSSRNVSVGDIVLIIDNAPHNLWVLGRVFKTFPDKHGLTRSAKVQTKHSVCTRPISKLCALLEAERV